MNTTETKLEDVGFRRTIVGLKPRVGIVRFLGDMVSDEPLWG